MSLPKTMLSKGMLEVVVPRSATGDEPAAHSHWPAKESPPNRIAVIGNYLPRHCGIATFTTDLCEAICAEYGTARLMALPNTEQGYDYPACVRWPLAQDDLSPYHKAAEFGIASEVSRPLCQP